MVKYPNGSKEPLDIIEANECNARPGSLSTQRFQACFNEIARLPSDAELALIVQWFNAAEDLAPQMMDEADRALMAKIMASLGRAKEWERSERLRAARRDRDTLDDDAVGYAATMAIAPYRGPQK